MGFIGLSIRAKAVPEADSNPNTARMNGIRGIVSARITFEYSESGSAPFDTRSFDFDIAPRAFNYNTGGSGNFWTAFFVVPPISLPGVGINSATIQLFNLNAGWGPETAIGAMWTSYAGVPVYTAQLVQAQTEHVYSGGTSVVVNPHRQYWNVIRLDASRTIDAPSPALETGQEVVYEIRKHAADPEATTCTFNASYFLDVPPLNQTPGQKQILRFRCVGSNVSRCIEFEPLPLSL
jgi:hypothetical protein